MHSGIRLTSREMRYIALFESITGANVKDCIIDDELNRIIFVVKQGDIGAAIGKGGKNILWPNSYKISGSKSPGQRSFEATTRELS